MDSDQILSQILQVLAAYMEKNEIKSFTASSAEMLKTEEDARMFYVNDDIPGEVTITLFTKEEAADYMKSAEEAVNQSSEVPSEGDMDENNSGND